MHTLHFLHQHSEKMEISIKFIDSLDLENYTNFVFNQITNDLSTWIAPTNEDKENINYWRELEFKRGLKLYETRVLGSASPNFIINDLINYKINELGSNPDFSLCFENIIIGFLPTDFYILSLVLGKIDFLKVLYKKVKQPQQNEAVKPDEVKKELHPKYDPNLWNNECFELFKYLYDCYYKTTKRQLTNIWFYLKENGNTKYNLKATKEQYESFIFENYQIKITNFDKAPTKWEDKEYDTIDDHRINFEDTLE